MSPPTRSAQEKGVRSASIGRDKDNDIALPDDLRASAHHAKLETTDGVVEIVDLGSHAGTFVNGARVSRSALAEGDTVTIGITRFRVEHGELVPLPSEPPALTAAALTVRTDDGHVLTDDVSFVLEPTSLMAIIGPSGCGKTTLLNALLGLRPIQAGSVRYGDDDLHATLEEKRQRIGYVPQDDILHPQLKVFQALSFAAELRFPSDVSRETRLRRINEVVQELELTGRSGTRIDTLSGGQRKRVSVALELLTKPPMLFLDEPTSGLDPGNERHLMAMLRDLASGGRTVVVVTHSTQSLHLCDRVLFLAPGGKVAFFGPPDQALAYFERAGAGNQYADIFTTLEDRPGDDWPGKFRADPGSAPYLPGKDEPRATAEPAVIPARPKRQQSFARQLRVLARRHLALLAADRRSLLLLAIQAPFFGLLFALLIRKDSLSLLYGGQAPLLIWLLVVGATWLGASNAAREIVKELPIYRRERSVGLSLNSYVASKVLILGSITIVQCVLMTLITLSRQHLGDAAAQDNLFAGQPSVPDMRNLFPSAFSGASPFAAGSMFHSPVTEILIDIALAGLAAMTLGLLLSALVRNSDQALVLLPLVLVAQVVLSQPFTDKPNPMLRGLGYVSSAQWAKDAAGSTVELNLLNAATQFNAELGARYFQVLEQKKQPFEPPELYAKLDTALRREPRWKHTSRTWKGEALALIVLLVVALAGTATVLLRRDVRVLQPWAPARSAAAPPTRSPVAPPVRGPPNRLAPTASLLVLGGVTLVGLLAAHALVGPKAKADPFPGSGPAKPVDSSLARHIPDALLARCTAGTPGAAEIARADCGSADGANVVEYRLFAGTSGANLVFETDMAVHDVRVSGSCATLGTARGIYNVADVRAGSLGCYPIAGKPFIEWTRDSCAIEVVASRARDSDRAALFAFWNIAGPIRC